MEAAGARVKSSTKSVGNHRRRPKLHSKSRFLSTRDPTVFNPFVLSLIKIGKHKSPATFDFCRCIVAYIPLPCAQTRRKCQIPPVKFYGLRFLQKRIEAFYKNIIRRIWRYSCIGMVELCTLMTIKLKTKVMSRCSTIRNFENIELSMCHIWNKSCLIENSDYQKL